VSLSALVAPHSTKTPSDQNDGVAVACTDLDCPKCDTRIKQKSHPGTSGQKVLTNGLVVIVNNVGHFQYSLRNANALDAL